GDRRDALAYFAKAIDALHWFGNRAMLGTNLDRIASLLADRDPEATAVLQGVGDARHPDFTNSPHHVEAHERAVALVDASLGAERRHALHDQGLAMNDPDAVDYAHAAIARYLSEPAI